MDEATLRHIGEPFFTTKAPGKGTGLGLASAMRVVREAGGELSVDSAVGIGTTFRITLPAYNDDVTPDGSPVEKQAASIGAILLVEDEPLVRKAIARVLQRLTPHVEAVEDGTRAIALLSDDPRPRFDLVLLDLSMPGIPGRRVLADIAARDPKLPVMVVFQGTSATEKGSSTPPPSSKSRSRRVSWSKSSRRSWPARARREGARSQVSSRRRTD